MKKSKRLERRDRLSELPDSLILHILSFLPVRYVVRTSLLSKRWKDLWTTIPCLNFDGDTKPFSGKRRNLGEFPNFVNRALMRWNGSKILKFDVDFTFSEYYTSDLDMWLRVAMENGVEELYVNLMGPDPDNVKFHTWCDYFAPQRFYSCSSIRKLSLLGCGVKVNGDVQWNQLKSLRIHGVSLSEDVLNQVLSGTPLLEVLILLVVESYENLNIRSSSLKTLKIEKGIDIDGADVDLAMDTTLTIWAPKVETLQIEGVFYSKCLLTNILSITSLTVRFSVPYENFIFPGDKLFEEMLGQVLQSASRVEKVTFSDWGIKVLGDMKKRKKDLLAPLSDAKFLKLYVSEVDEIVGLLEIFPELTMLVLENSSLPKHKDYLYFEILFNITEPFVPKFDAENSLESKTIVPKSCDLMHLRRVEINWILRDNSIFPFIEFLLKYAIKLEKMVFRVTGDISLLPPDSLLLAEQKLLSMPSTSPTAEVIMCVEGFSYLGGCHTVRSK